jgi:uncharacterized protein
MVGSALGKPITAPVQSFDDLPSGLIDQFCRKWQIECLSVFGSIVRNELSPQSDIDFLVEFEPQVCYGFREILEAQDELSAIVGRFVDFVIKKSLERSANYVRKRNIFESARIIFFC